MKKRILSILLAVAMLASLCIVSVGATDAYNAVVTVQNKQGSGIEVVVTADTGAGDYNIYFVDPEHENVTDEGITTYAAFYAKWANAKSENNFTSALGDAVVKTVTVALANDTVDNTKDTGKSDVTGLTASKKYWYVAYANSQTSPPGEEIELDANGRIPVNYTVTFDTNGGNGTVSDANYTGAAGIAEPTEVITKDGYRLIGWSTTADNANTKVTFPYAPAGNITLHALWAQEFSVTYALDGGAGTLPTSDDRIQGEKFNLAASTGLTKKGYTFGGWNDGTTTYNAGAQYTMGGSAVTLTAVWNEIPVTLTGNDITVKTNNDVGTISLPTAAGGSGDGFDYTTTVTGTLPAGLTLSADGATPNTLTGTPTAEGEATISYTATDKTTGATKTIQIKVTVSDKDPATLTVTPSVVNGKVGGTQNLAVTTNSTGAKSFVSSDEDVVTVDENGKLTFVGEGEAEITITVATDENYASNTAKVTVKVSSAAEPHAAFMFGYANTKNFGPDDSLNRAQAVTILARLDGWTDGEETPLTGAMFSDVKEKDAAGNDIWYYDAVCYAKENGIVEGFADGTFGADKPITRAEFTKMLSRLSNGGVDPADADSTLADAKAHWANKWIADVETTYPGSITGRQDGKFHPDDKITRAETAKIINACLGRLQLVSPKEEDQMDADLNAFDDVIRCTWYYNNVIEATVDHDASDADFHTVD